MLVGGRFEVGGRRSELLGEALEADEVADEVVDLTGSGEISGGDCRHPDLEDVVEARSLLDHRLLVQLTGGDRPQSVH